MCIIATRSEYVRVASCEAEAPQPVGWEGARKL